MMALYESNAPAEAVNDVSQVALSATLVPEQRGIKRAVAFTSWSLSKVERHYRKMEKEKLAVVWGCERFNLYLSAELKSFQLVATCKALEATYGPESKPLARVERISTKTFTTCPASSC